MAINLHTIKGDLRPIRDRVLVSDMHFGEQKTKAGLIVLDDDTTTRGIYPRWGKVYAKGPKNEDDYSVGEWILIEHGRWTRSCKIDNGDEEIVLRMVDADCVLAYSQERPSDVSMSES
tara:strand:+ start:18 stop:371 length:354 start_codon:yes stop_codon:yes gene_type:complete